MCWKIARRLTAASYWKIHSVFKEGNIILMLFPFIHGSMEIHEVKIMCVRLANHVIFHLQSTTKTLLCTESPLTQLRLVSGGSDQCGPPVWTYLCRPNISLCIYGGNSNPFETQQRVRTLFFFVKAVYLWSSWAVNTTSIDGTACVDLIFTHGCYIMLPHQPTELFTTSKRHSTWEQSV